MRALLNRVSWPLVSLTAGALLLLGGAAIMVYRDRDESGTNALVESASPDGCADGADCCEAAASRGGATLSDRRGAEEFMLMMQGMAGIRPEDSKWVSSKLFDGFLPAAMPCCGPPGGKSPVEEHQCCQVQKAALEASASASVEQRALVRYRQMFQTRPTSSVHNRTPHRASAAPSGPAKGVGPADEAPAGLRVAVLPGSDDGDTLPPGLDRAKVRHYRVAAISAKIWYNRFGDCFDPDGMMYVLEKDREKVLAGQGAFNAGHDPLFHGTGHDGQLFLKDPKKGEEILKDGQKIPVLTTEPLVLRANRGDTVVIDFTNRLSPLCNALALARTNLFIEGANVDDSALPGPTYGTPLPAAADQRGYQVRYVIQVGGHSSTDGTYYFHSKPVLPDTRQDGFSTMRLQVAHGLFGALVIEPPGSKYFDVSTFKIKSETKYGDYEIDESGYLPIESGWGAIIANEDPTIPAFREYVIFFHDDLGSGNQAKVKNIQGEPRALSYRTEPFENTFGITAPETVRPFAVNEKSMAYSAYTYGDASTPHPRFYVGDPMRYRIVHSGMGGEFHVFHHHAHRWRFQPNLKETNAGGGRANETRTSKFGRPESPGQPDATDPVSTRVDSQTLAPGETFDVVMEGGAGGVQRTVGDALLHCHIISHVTLGMWTYNRVYNTLQQPTTYQPGLAPLPGPHGLPRDRLLPPIAVDSVTLAEMARDPKAPKTIPVSGPLAGKEILDVVNVLYPFLKNQLPPQGKPVADEIARTHKDHTDTTPINRANVWPWTTVPAGPNLLFLGEKYDSDPASPSRVKFGIGFPTVGEGVGVDRKENGPAGPLDRPRLLFNPRDGRLAYPHLLPHAGRRPPFAPRPTPQTQGTAYLGPRIKPEDPGYPFGAPTGGGLAPHNAPVKHYDLVALQVPGGIDYSTYSGAPIARKIDFGVASAASPSGPGGTPPVKKIEGFAPMTWSPAEVTVQPGDVVEWTVASGTHGVMFADWAKAQQVLEVQPESLPFGAQGYDAPAQGTMALAATPGGILLVRAKVKAIPAGMTEVSFFCTAHDTFMSGKLKLQGAAPQTVTVNGVAPMAWEPATVPVKPGDVVEWRVKSGFHGVVFSDFDKAKQVLKIDTAASRPIQAQAGFPASAQGTDGAGAGTLLVRATVQAIPAGITEVPFVCTVHGNPMAGKLLLQSGSVTHTIRAIAGLRWEPKEVQVKPGDFVEWRVESDTHGVMFFDGNKAKQVLKIESGTVKSQDGFPAPQEGTDPAGPGSLLLRVRVEAILPGMTDVPFFCTVHGPGMDGKLQLTGEPVSRPPALDPLGQIFVLADDVPDIVKGLKPAEPLVIRANVGEVVDITLRSALVDQTENFFHSKVGIHTHLVQYDVQSSDGAVGGLNYETSIRPSLRWDEGRGQLVDIPEAKPFEEVVRYRWWCDVELGTVYFHDHSMLFNSLPRGLFGANVVEPAGAKYYDPVTGRPIYKDPTPDGRITATTGRGVAVADIRLRENTPQEGGFREFVPLFDDGNKAVNRASINLRSEPLETLVVLPDGVQVPRTRWYWGHRPPEVFWLDGKPTLWGGVATAFSSRLYGDPATPLWRAFPDDPFRLRVEGSGTDSIHTLNVFGHRWRYEHNNERSPLRDFVLAGISEAFTFRSVANPGFPAGDYLYGSPGVNSLVHDGKWGLLRVHALPGGAEGAKATGKVLVYLDKPAKVTIKAGKEFFSRRGVVYEATADEIAIEAIAGNTTGQFRPGDGPAMPAFYFSVDLTARDASDRANLPEGAEFGTDPSDLFGGVADPPRILKILSAEAFADGKSALQSLPGKARSPAAPAKPPGVVKVGGPLYPAPEPLLKEPADFHVAALDVQLPVDPTQPNGTFRTILAYVPLTQDQRKLAEAITTTTRKQMGVKQAAEGDVQKLSAQLRAAFRLRPEPLVLRVAAPANPKQMVRVTVRLTNLLPQPGQPPDPLAALVGEPVTSLHPSLVRYNVAESDGSAVGVNPHSLVVRGDSRTYVWQVDQDLGVCALRDMAVPAHHRAGLFGALIVEPPGTSPVPSASATPESADKKVYDCQAVVSRLGGPGFREFVVFVHDGFPATAAGFAVNYYAVDNKPGPPVTPRLAAHAGDPVRVRLVHAAGNGGNHSFFFGGRRWPFDPEGSDSNHTAAIALGPWTAFNLHVTADTPVKRPRTYYYGARVADQLVGGEWGLFQVLLPDDSSLRPVK